MLRQHSSKLAQPELNSGASGPLRPVMLKYKPMLMRLDWTESVLWQRTPNPLPFQRPECSSEFPNLAISAAGFLGITPSRVTHNPKVGGSNPPPQPKNLLIHKGFRFFDREPFFFDCS
jgi:hypothetical protein